MKTLKDLGDLKGKRVLVRADFNVPLDGTTITDDGRIKAALPTIKALREEGAKVILMAHLGRPKGKVVPELSLAPVATRLGELLGVEVPLASDTYGEDAQAKVAAMNDGDVVLLQNVRFNPEETSKDPEERAAYAKKIAALGEAFVSDGFGVVHRAQGSNYDVAADLPAAAGLLVEKEVKALSRATVDPERPLTVVLGGSKVSDKLGVIENLLDKADRLVIGGGMVYSRSSSTTRSSTPRPSCGTVRWVCSRFRPSQPVPRPLPRVWSTPLRPVRSPSSVAVIPLPQCAISASRRMASPTSPPAAAPPSSSSRARNCRV